MRGHELTGAARRVRNNYRKRSKNNLTIRTFRYLFNLFYLDVPAPVIMFFFFYVRFLIFRYDIAVAGLFLPYSRKMRSFSCFGTTYFFCSA